MKFFFPSGELISEDKEIVVEELPQKVMSSFNKEYSNYKVTQAYSLKSPDAVQYKLVATSSRGRVHLWINDSGVINSKRIFSGEKKKAANSTGTGGLSSIEAKWELPTILNEISGIAMIDQNKIACVQDEIGVIFIYDLIKKSIIDSIGFGSPGDYEGIAIVRNDIYVLRSDGQLTFIENYSGLPKVSTFMLKLSQSTQNFEGLCYDEEMNRLLIAPRVFDSSNRNVKNIYAFDLSTKKFIDAPVISLKLNDEIFNTIVSKKDVLIPSGILVHPGNGRIYVTDARNKYVLISDKNGKPIKVLRLDGVLFAKTEGITVGSDGMFYLSNEGKGGPATIIKVSPDKMN
ncbi:MAG: SdiA-regulated domain-containing protein [Bacteroidetes bacterium]|nr:SdiA-regulated domain-containing protein [Bacteroidota bacterium]